MSVLCTKFDQIVRCYMQIFAFFKLKQCRMAQLKLPLQYHIFFVLLQIAMYQTLNWLLRCTYVVATKQHPDAKFKRK